MTTPGEAALLAAIERLTAAVDALRAQTAAGEAVLLGPKEAAAYLGYGPTKFEALVQDGHVPPAVGFATRGNPDRRWRRADLARCVERMKRHRVK